MKKENQINLSLENKTIIWMHYVALCLSLKHGAIEFPLGMTNIDYSKTINYPILGVATMQNLFNNIKIKSFDCFCECTDDRTSESLIGHFWRFKHEISLV
jgi:hypothetical protein